ncbi:MAG: hypothetical protein Q7V31_03210 [Parvibaculum sp.]|uniref:hypothetical protein n=1 Tax=Parvibaculum sp. TaxID=2024848 RepID=UPI0027193402|nr:hypothetical protein [Parvibaculum sp.]MDO8837911.1 hypothetical protein [Parvibaculum sp.]
MIKKMKDTKSRPEFFGLRTEADALEDSIFVIIEELQKQHVRQTLPPENSHSYTHGQTWTSRANPEVREGGFQTHAVEWTNSFDEIVANDLSLILRFVEHVAAELNKQFSEMIYSSINKVCEETGNVVSSADAGSFAAGFLEMMRKIEFGVDRQGRVTLPEVHTGADPSKFIAELEAQPPEYHEEIERLKDEKSKAALEREALRKLKFKTRAALCSVR